jgi:hypothetical protein
MTVGSVSQMILREVIMTYRGRVRNGVVVLESGVQLREGMDVRVEPVGETEGIAEGSQEARQLQEGLLAFSGVIKEGPPDLARNHDRYLHGTPRR